MAAAGAAGARLLLPPLALLLLAASAGAAGPLASDAGPGVGVVAPLVLALARNRNVRCVFLLHDDYADDGLAGPRAAAALRRRLSWAGVAAALLAFRRVAGERQRLRCLGRALHVLLASDAACARFLTQLSESEEWGMQGPAAGGGGSNGTKDTSVASNPMWLLFLLNATVSTFFANIALPYDAEVLAARQFRTITELTEVWRVAPGQPLRDATWGRFALGVLRAPTRSLYDRRASLQGVRLTVVTQHYPPFSLVGINQKTKKEEATGFMGEIWKSLQHKLNFTTRWVVIPESDPKDRTFEELAAGRADVALMDYTLTMQRLRRVEFSTPVLFTSYRVFVADAGYRLVNWLSYLEPFRPELWAVELLTMSVLAVTLATFYHVGRRLLGPEANLEDEDSYTLYNSMFYVFGAFCMQGHDVTPRSCALRVVYLVVYLTAIILMAAYSAALISFLAVQATAMPFADVAGLLADGRYDFATARNSSGHQMMKETTDEMLQRLAAAGAHAAGAPAAADVDAAAASWPPDYLSGLQEVCRRRLALLAPQEYAVTFADRVACTPVALPGFRLRVGMSFAFAKQCPYRGVINHNLDRMRKSGALSKLLLDARPPGGGDSAEAGGLTDVDLGDVAPLLAALTTGTLIAGLFLCAERLLYRRKKAQRASPLFVGPLASADAPSPTPPPTRDSLAAPAFAHLVRTKNRFLV